MKGTTCLHEVTVCSGYLWTWFTCCAVVQFCEQKKNDNKFPAICDFFWWKNINATVKYFHFGALNSWCLWSHYDVIVVFVLTNMRDNRWLWNFERPIMETDFEWINLDIWIRTRLLQCNVSKILWWIQEYLWCEHENWIRILKKLPGSF